MRDWSDNRLDDLVESALHSASLTPQQKRHAWERLHSRAAAQVMLPPLVAPVTTKSKLSLDKALRCSAEFSLRVLDGCLSLLFDDTRYDRALRQRSQRFLGVMHESPLRNLMGGVAT